MTSTGTSRQLAFARRAWTATKRLLWQLPPPTEEERRELTTLHDTRELEAVRQILQKRAGVLKDSLNALKTEEIEADQAKLFKLATADLFVEKAQRVLTQRADDLWSSGMWALRAVLGVLALAAIISIAFILRGPPQAVDGSWEVLVATVLASISLGGIFFAVAKFLIAIARAMFHESQVLRDRRDAYRFGRMGVYLAKEEVTVSALESMFRWNTADVTAFLDIKPEVLAANPFTQAFQRLLELPSDEQFA
ncbi:MAG TPA: hypothetical protein PKI89_07255, partial [Tepidiformaceae bacterium]|nr:hypothetical protein [Tepidiformaceae bacterium]